MNSDQHADQLDNLAGTPSESASPSLQEFPSDVDSNIDVVVTTAFQAAEPAINPVGNLVDGPDRISPVGAWPHEDHPRQMGEGPKIREVALLADEAPTHIFSGADGLTSEVPATGQLLVVTNQRVIAFCHAEGKQETYLVSIDEVKHVVVKGGSRNASMLLQGSLMVVAGIFIYLVFGYWLTNQIEGPTIPVLHMDAAPFIAFMIMLTGLTMIAHVYFTKPDGTVTVNGDGLQFIFQFHGDDAQSQIFDLVNAAFAARQTRLQDEPQLETGHSTQSASSADMRMETSNSHQLNEGDDRPSPWASST